MRLDWFFRRYPGALFLLRLALFGGAFPALLWKIIDSGELYMKGVRIDRADEPYVFAFLVAIMVIASLLLTAGSIIAYLKRRELIGPRWRFLGLDFRR